MPKGLGNNSIFINSSNFPVIIRPEAKFGNAYNDQHDVVVPPGATYYGYICDSPKNAEYNGQPITGIDAVWDPIKGKWFKVVDNVTVVVTKDGKIITYELDVKSYLGQPVRGGYKNWDHPWEPPTNIKPATNDELTPPPSPAEPGDKDKDKNPASPGDGENPGDDGDTSDDDDAPDDGAPSDPENDEPAPPGVPQLPPARKIPGLPPARKIPGPGLSHPADPILDKIAPLWNKGKNASSPLILDLDGDGIETIAKEKGVFLDHDNNGFDQITGWAAADDGLLVFDRNGNGIIDNGSELFGNNTILNNDETAANGFLALPDCVGFGNGYNLHQVIVQNSSACADEYLTAALQEAA